MNWKWILPKRRPLLCFFKNKNSNKESNTKICLNDNLLNSIFFLIFYSVIVATSVNFITTMNVINILKRIFFYSNHYCSEKMKIFRDLVHSVTCNFLDNFSIIWKLTIWQLLASRSWSVLELSRNFTHSYNYNTSINIAKSL